MEGVVGKKWENLETKCNYFSKNIEIPTVFRFFKVGKKRDDFFVFMGYSGHRNRR